MMTKFSNEKKLSLTAAICYAAYVLGVVVNLLDDILYSGLFLLSVHLILAVPSIAMAVGLFIQNKKVIAIAAGASTFLCMLTFISAVHDSFLALLSVAVCAAAYMSVIVLLSLSHTGNTVVKKIWFVPAALLLLGFAIMEIRYFYTVTQYFLLVLAPWRFVQNSSWAVAALLFFGLWFKESFAPVTTPINEYATFNPQAVHSAPSSSSAPVIGGADKLKMYNELLKSGTITQEEFDAKKMQILGL